MEIQHPFSNNVVGLACATVTGFLKAVFLIVEQPSLLSTQAIFETVILSAIAALVGILVNEAVKWVKVKWLGIVKKKRNGTN